MNIQSLRPASDFAQQYGVKSVIYGPPGSAKTPLINTAPRPILLATEPGLLSMRGSNVPTFLAPDAKTIDEFFTWFFNSNENKNFDTLAIDSGTQMAETYLLQAEATNKHGLKAYGEMADNTMKQLRQMYFMPQKHIYLIAKEQITEDNNVRMRRPYYPGRELPIKVPHLFDFVLRLDTHNVPGVGQVRAFRCNSSFEEMARARTGNLNDYEEPHFGKLIQKAMK